MKKIRLSLLFHTSWLVSEEIQIQQVWPEPQSLCCSWSHGPRKGNLPSVTAVQGARCESRLEFTCNSPSGWQVYLMGLFLESLLQMSAWTWVMLWTQVWPAEDLCPHVISGFPSQNGSHDFLPNVPWSSSWPRTCCWKGPLSKRPLTCGAHTPTDIGSLLWSLKHDALGFFPAAPNLTTLTLKPQRLTEIVTLNTRPLTEAAFGFCLQGNGLKDFRNNASEKKKVKNNAKKINLWIEKCAGWYLKMYNFIYNTQAHAKKNSKYRCR